MSNSGLIRQLGDLAILVLIVGGVFYAVKLFVPDVRLRAFFYVVAWIMVAIYLIERFVR